MTDNIAIAFGTKIENAIGTKFSDRIEGNALKNNLKGLSGNDKIKGRAGADKLDGGKGNDKLFGGKGADKFVFKNNYDKDAIKDFQDNKDTILINDNLWNGSKSVKNILNKFGSISGSDFVLDFGDGDILTVDNTTKSQLQNDIDII